MKIAVVLFCCICAVFGANLRIKREEEPEEPIKIETEEEFRKKLPPPEEIFKRVDTDGNEKLTFTEFQLGDPHLKSDFNETDEDHDDIVTKEEFPKYYKHLLDSYAALNISSKLPSEDNLFEQSDKNDDGKLSKVEFFQTDPDKVEFVTEDWETFDENKDKVWTVEEFKDFFSQPLLDFPKHGGKVPEEGPDEPEVEQEGDEDTAEGSEEGKDEDEDE